MWTGIRTAIEWVKARVVYVATSEKFIQSVLSGSAFAIIAKTVVLLAIITNWIIYYVFHQTLPRDMISLPVVVLVFGAAFWADNHTEWFRAWVAEETGEEPAEDTE